MFWLFIMIVVATLGANITIGVLTPYKNFMVWIIGMILALAILVIGTIFFWKHAIVALADE